MEHVNKLHYLASELLAGVLVESVADWKLELGLARQRAQQTIWQTAILFGFVGMGMGIVFGAWLVVMVLKSIH